MKTGISHRCKRLFASLILALFLLSPTTSWACTSIVVGKDASATGNILFARTEDYSPTNAKRFRVYPAGYYKAGDSVSDLYNGFSYTFTHNSYKFTGDPDMEVNEAGIYDAHGVNEHGLAISATNTTDLSAGAAMTDPLTDGGLTEAVMTTIVLAECKAVDEAITLLGNIIETAGAGEGYTFTIADQDQAWIMEGVSGHQWVASRVPDDSFAVIVNDMVTDRVDLSDGTNYRASSGIVTFAEENDFAIKNADGTLNVAASYGSLNEDGNRYRRWRGYNLFAPSRNIALKETTDTLPYDLFVKPDARISPTDIMNFQRDRYNGTAYDISHSEQLFDDLGQEADASPRPIGVITQPETHVYEMVRGYPAAIGARFWLAMAQSEHSVNLPFYGAITDTHPFYKTEALFAEYQADSAFWIFQDLAYLARSDRANYGDPIKNYWRNYELKLYEEQTSIETDLLYTYLKSPADAAAMITDYTVATSQAAMNRAKLLREALKTHIATAPGTRFVVPTESTPYVGFELDTNVPFTQMNRIQAALDISGLAADGRIDNYVMTRTSETESPAFPGCKSIGHPGYGFEADVAYGNITKARFTLELKGAAYAAFGSNKAGIESNFTLLKSFPGTAIDPIVLIGPQDEALVSTAEAIRNGIVTVYNNTDSATVVVEYFVFDGDKGCAYDGTLLVVSDGRKDGKFTDPLWAKVHGVSDGGSSSGCATGAGFAALLLIALGTVILRRHED